MLGAKALSTSAYEKISNHGNQCLDYYTTTEKHHRIRFGTYHITLASYANT